MSTTLETGDMLDHYRLEQTIARGGMGTLFKATDLNNGRLVAIKVPHPEMEADPVLVARFRREEAIGQELDHPGVVKTYRDEHRSRDYMVIEWVEGRLLRTLMNEQPQMPIKRAVAIVLSICDALDCMHKHGVVHRDLKPENIMVNEKDQIKLIDFGIAMKEDARRLTFTSLSSVLGTPDYISPEQVKGNRGDQRSDIYSLGIIFYEMLTGETPFSGPNPLAVMNERLQRDPKPAAQLNPAVTAELQEVLDRALERNPRHRYATASEMSWDLEHPELLGLEEGDRPPLPSVKNRAARQKMLIFAALALVPLMIFVLMLLLARW
jgi:eukaryotic-like serine/threonine-protein kinase